MEILTDITLSYTPLDWSRVYASLSLVPHVGKGRWLDCGAGDGHVSQKIKNINPNTFALELNESYKVTLRHYLGDHNVACPSSITAMPYPANFFDGLSVFETLEHLTNEQLAIAVNEIKRVVKPNGWIMGSVPIKDSIADPDHKQKFYKSELLALFPTLEFYEPRIERPSDRALLWFLFRGLNEK